MPTLVDRLEVVQFDGYSMAEKEEIVRHVTRIDQLPALALAEADPSTQPPA